MKTQTLLLAVLLPCIFVSSTVSARAEIPAGGLTLEEAFSEPPVKQESVLVFLEPGKKVYLPKPLSTNDVVITPKGIEPWDLHYYSSPGPPSRSSKGVTYKVEYLQPYMDPLPKVTPVAPYKPYYSSDPVPVLPIGADQIESGTIYGNVYNVYDKAGKNYSGVVVGDSDYSITYPMGKGDPVMRSGNMIINLGR